MFRRLIVLVASLGTVLGVSLIAAPSSSAACGYGSPVDLQNVFSSQTYAGVDTRTNIPFVFRYSNAGCLEGMIFTFIGGGGTDVQAMRANVTTGGVSGDASVNWIPKPLEYKLLVDVVYRWGGEFGGLSTSRWTYEKVLSSGAFRTLPAPSAPTSATLRGDDRNLTVSWGPPASNASSAVKYTVRYPDGTVLCEVPTSQFSCTAGNQADGTYAFIISAVNQLGAGAEIATPPVTVAPPGTPGFSAITRVAQGKRVQLTWPTSTGTTALARVFRVTDQSGKEVCGSPVTAVDASTGSMSCTVTPAKNGSRYTLKVETNMGVMDSAPTPALKPKATKKKKR